MSPLKAWANLLAAAAPTSQNTPATRWICETWDARDGQGHVYKALTPQEYQAFYATHSWWDRTFNCSCKKLSLEEINSLSWSHWSNYRSNQATAARAIERAVWTQNINSVDAEDTIKTQLANLKPDRAIQQIKDSLSAFSNRSAAKHTADKTHGFFGKIRWAIWYYLNNTSESINNLIGRMSAKNNFSELCQKACNAMKERIIMNMDWFEESVHYRGDGEHPRTDSLSPAAAVRFATPKDVQKKWMVKFGVDKFTIPTPPEARPRRGVPDFASIMAIKPHEVIMATDSRTRIYAMVGIWNHLVEFQKEQAEADAPPPPAPPATPLLQ